MATNAQPIFVLRAQGVRTYSITHRVKTVTRVPKAMRAKPAIANRVTRCALATKTPIVRCRMAGIVRVCGTALPINVFWSLQQQRVVHPQAHLVF